MARIWLTGSTYTRPGVYFKTSSGDVTVDQGINGICAVVYQSNWGALNEVVDIDVEDMNNLQDIVGTGSGYNAIYQAFVGGAQRVRSVRVGTCTETAGTCASVVLNSATDAGAEETSKPAMTITAKYPGTRKFTASFKTDLATGKRYFGIYEGTHLVEGFSVVAGEKESLRLYHAIIDNSKYFTATYTLKESDNTTLKPTRLAECMQKSFTNGTNPTVNTASYSDGLGMLERYTWNVVITDSNTDAVHQLLTSYIIQCYEMGQFGMTVIGGTLEHKVDGATVAYTVSDRIDYATALNDWRVVFLLSGWVGTDGKKYDGYEAAARIAGMIAGCESNASLTHIVISGAFKPLENLTNSQMINAEEGGCFVLSPNDEGQVWVDNSINTLVTLNNDQDSGWSKIRRTKCRFELMTRVNRTCDRLIGRLNNDANGRATIVTAMTTVIREMIGERKLFEGSYAEEDPRYQPVGDTAYFVLHIGDIDSMEKLFLNYTFSYANPFAEQDAVTTA